MKVRRGFSADCYEPGRRKASRVPAEYELSRRAADLGRGQPLDDELRLHRPQRGARIRRIVEELAGAERVFELMMPLDAFRRDAVNGDEPAHQGLEARDLRQRRPLAREVSQEDDADAAGVVAFRMGAEPVDRPPL